MSNKLLFVLPLVAYFLSERSKGIGITKASGLTKKELQEMVDDMLLNTPVSVLNRAIKEHDVRIISSFNQKRQTDKYHRYGHIC